jgi:hypothetical protein
MASVLARPAVASLAVACAALLPWAAAFPPFWETNDDVAMSMMAHGYGLAAYPSAQLLFSNLAWGKLLGILPAIAGVLPYSWASLAAVFAAAWMIAHLMALWQVPRWIALVTAALIFAKPIVLPQFTMTAGLLAAAAALGWRTYVDTGLRYLLPISSGLALAGFLIRYDECLLVLAVGAPLFAHRRVLGDRWLLGSFAIFATVIAVFTIVDAASYERQEWHAYSSLAFYVKAFADYGVLPYFQENLEIARRHGFSLNDLMLVMRFFHIDPQVADPARLAALLGEIEPARAARSNWAKGLLALRSLVEQPALAALSVPAIALAAVLRPGWRVAGTWALFLAAIFAIGLLGRAGQARVYYPLVALALLAALLCRKPAPQPLAWAGAAVTLALVGALAALAPAHARVASLHDVVARDVGRLDPSRLYVDWGGQFPYEAAHPVLLRDKRIRRIRIYALASASVAPFSLAQWVDQPSKGLVPALLSGRTVPLIADGSRLELLREYCRAHHGRRMRVERVDRLETFSIHHTTCGEP